MCKCNQNNKCSCNQNPCGCEKIDSKCVLYNGVCLTNLGICADTDLEEIIIIIDGLIQDILEQIEQAWTAANIGGGAEVYKGISSLGIHMFRTLIDSVSVNVVENENNISLAVDEDWLEEVIIRIVDDIISNIPDTELDSPLNSISITSTGTNEFELDLNPTTFTSPNSSVTITSTTIGGVLRINFQINPSYINSLLPDIVNVGTGADIYKGLNGNNHEFRGITTQVTQPSTTNNQITGTVGASAVVAGDNVQVNLDFSNLRVPLQQVGIPEYYVHSAGDDTTADGSIVRPYKTWEACRTAIIGSGSILDPQIVSDGQAVRVIFLSNITSTEPLTLNRVTFDFRNDSVFSYSGSDFAVIDMQKLITFNLSPNKTISGYIRVEGNGTITRTQDAATPYPIIRAAGYTNPDSSSIFFNLRFTSGNIIIREKETDTSTYFDPALNSTGGALLNSASRPVYVLKKTGINDIIPATQGNIVVSGKNSPVRDSLYIDDGCNLTIRTEIQRAVYMEDEASLTNYGNIILDLNTVWKTRYGEDLKITNPSDPKVNNQGQYTPSNNVSLIDVKGGSSFITSSGGSINAYLLGSVNQGGYNSFVSLEDDKSNFEVASDNALLINAHSRYRYLLYLEDNTSTSPPENRKQFRIEYIFSRIGVLESIIGATTGVTGQGVSVTISNGTLEGSSNIVTEDRVFSNSTLKSNINIGTSLLTFATFLSKNINQVPNFSDNSAATSAGLLSGMVYRTDSGGSSILKITT